jgi:HK97 family phage prohead protease
VRSWVRSSDFAPADKRSAPGPLRYRSAQALAADASDRIIELLVVPYGVSAQVPWGDGRLVSESFARGAFSEAERSPSRVRINRDHDLKRTVGKALDFQDDPIGLLGVLKIAATPLGDETLALAEDGCLDASVGYRPEPGGEEWQGRSRVRIRRAHLGHVALTPDPAYEHARVLTVGGAAAGW